MTRRFGVAWLLSLIAGPSCLAEGVAKGVANGVAKGIDGALPDDPEAVALQADDGALGVRQQHHVAHADIEQELRADAVVAELAAGLGPPLQARPHRPREATARRHAHQSTPATPPPPTHHPSPLNPHPLPARA